MKHSIEYYRNKMPKCPHCDTDFDVWADDHPHSLNYEDGGKTTFECAFCNKEFIAVTNIEYSFSTAVSEEMADDDEWGPQETEDAE